MDRVISAVGLAWIASPTMSLALRARSLGLQRSGRLAGALSLAVFLAALSGAFFKPDERVACAVELAIWGPASTLCVGFGWAALRASYRADAAGIGPRLRLLVLGWWGLAAICGAFTVCALLPRDSNPELPVLYGAGLCSWAAILVASVGLARRHAARGAHGLAGVGWGLTAWSVGFVAVPLLAVKELVPGELALLAVVSFPIALPIATRLLVGSGPEPLDLAIHVEPLDSTIHVEPLDSTIRVEPRRRSRTAAKQAALATLCLVAFGVQALTFSLHYQRCRGALVAAPAPPDWQALPVSATYDTHNRLGTFVFRAGHYNYKGYPAAFEDARLGDPALCFGSSVSLDGFFHGDMYRGPGELNLRQTDGGVFLVAASHWGQHEQLIASFRRDVSPRGMFDSEFNAELIIGGALLVALGIGGVLYGRLRATRGPRDIARPIAWLSVLCLFGALNSALIVRQRWNADDTPRPGREFATSAPWMI